jgi:hypothetical protein
LFFRTVTSSLYSCFAVSKYTLAFSSGWHILPPIHIRCLKKKYVHALAKIEGTGEDTIINVEKLTLCGTTVQLFHHHHMPNNFRNLHW